MKTIIVVTDKNHLLQCGGDCACDMNNRQIPSLVITNMDLALISEIKEYEGRN